MISFGDKFFFCLPYIYYYKMIIISKIKGGNGANGKKGRDSLYSDIDRCQAWKGSIGSTDRSLHWNCGWNQDVCVPYDVCRANDVYNYDCPDVCSERSAYIVLYDVSPYSGDAYYFYFLRYGSPGEKGGDAGRGGVGGSAGLSGRAILQDKHDSFTTKFESNSQEENLSGKNGSPGTAGLGGLYGNTIYRKWYYYNPGIKSTVFSLGLLNLARFSNGFQTYGDRTEYSSERAANGRVYSTLNNANQKKPEDTEKSLSVYSQKTAFLRFLAEESVVFPASRLLHSSFCRDVLLNATTTSPTVEFKASQLIERISVISGFFSESNHLLAGLNAEVETYYLKEYNLSAENRLVVEYARAAMSSMSLRHRHVTKQSSHAKSLVVDVKAFLAITAAQMKKRWQGGIMQQSARKMYRDDFNSSLKIKLQAAQEFIASLGDDIEQRRNEVSQTWAMQKILVI